MRTEAQLRQDVCDALAEDPRVRGAELTVAATHGIVLIRGVVDTGAQRHAAIMVAGHAARGRPVDAEIEVRAAGPRAHDIREEEASYLTYEVEVPVGA
jgi:hypothetical protein